MKKIEISLVITVLNERASIEALLATIRNQTVLPHETIIVDGGSQDGTFEYLQKHLNIYRTIGLKLIQCPGNRSLGRNTGIEAAKYHWIALTDAGCVPHTDWLEELKKTLIDSSLRSDFPESIVVAGYYDAQPNTPFEAAVVPYVLVPPHQVNPETFLPATRSMMISTWMWRELGGFNLKLSDNEDYDFARRLKKMVTSVNQSGYEPSIQIIFARNAVVTWIPRKTLTSFAWMIYRFARGDAQAQLWRPKVALIFLRYGLMILSGVFFLAQPNLVIGLGILSLILLYISWSIAKNFQQAKAGWYWLPILQVTSDLAVMLGTLRGLVKMMTLR
jgi:glycosyltransferase involved in cell wall biosynthesis